MVYSLQEDGKAFGPSFDGGSFPYVGDSSSYLLSQTDGHRVCPHVKVSVTQVKVHWTNKL